MCVHRFAPSWLMLRPYETVYIYIYTHTHTLILTCQQCTLIIHTLYLHCVTYIYIAYTNVCSQVRTLMADAEAGKELEIDLPNQKIVRPGGETIPFEVRICVCVRERERERERVVLRVKAPRGESVCI
jgi:hypothetical protein